MTTQSEAALENGLIKTLIDNSYERVIIKEEENLKTNFKVQLEKHNQKELQLHGRSQFTDKEFEKILIYLEGGTRFEKAKKLRDLYPLETEDGERIWVEFLNQKKWCQNEFQVANQIAIEGHRQCRYDVTILINGLPLVQIELKKRGVELKQAYNQIQRYHKTSFHGLFDYIQLFVISNGVNTRYFANNPNSGYKFTFNWTDAENRPFNDLNMFANFFFDKCTLGKIISKYVVLHEGDKSLMVLRPYQFYAVEKIIDKVENTNKNGYVWHTTGAGKTLTSFKAAQLVSEIDGIDKVMFVVDRHDLDTQTQSEYEAFEPGAVDNTDNTHELIKRLSGDSKIIITTIQKLNCAVTKDYYNRHLQEIRNKKVVMIFDECHRSHFGDCHKNIVNFFNNLQIFGFTGTPIFVENAKQEHTTAEVFGECLHKYLIKDAIADENVLGFLVEYYQGSTTTDCESEARMREIAQFILNNYDKSTFGGEYNALFAIQSVPMLLRYYKIFKELNPKIRIGAIFTYAANASLDDGQTGMNQGFADSKVAADELQAIMDDYNGMFGTSFTTDNFSAYYDDVNERMKKRKKDMLPLDLLLVVGMFLTGFDAKKLNTLYVDKNLEYHGLLQAFSRTNRLFGPDKPFGVIRYYRKPHTMYGFIEAAVKLYSGDRPLDLFVQKLPANVKSMDTRYLEILDVFTDNGESDLMQLPESVEARRKFAKEFVELNRYLEAAKVQGFDWNTTEYKVDGTDADDADENDGGNGEPDIVRPQIDERTYLILAQRYKELFDDDSCTGEPDDDGRCDPEAPYELEGYLTEIDTGLIDTDYMNANFVKWLKALKEDSPELAEMSAQLHRSFAALSRDEQRLAELFLHDVERGDVEVEEGMTLRDYITRYAKREKDEQIDKLVDHLGVDRSLLEELTVRYINEKSLNAFGRFDALRDTIDVPRAKSFFERCMNVTLPNFKVKVQASKLLKQFVLEGGFDIDEEVSHWRFAL